MEQKTITIAVDALHGSFELSRAVENANKDGWKVEQIVVMRFDKISPPRSGLLAAEIALLCTKQ